MQRRAGLTNPKRRVDPFVDPQQLEDWASRLRYTGNPEHKRNPGDYGLTPPADPRPDKTLCDRVGIFRRADAAALLRAGIRRGLVSVQRRGGWPQNVWSVLNHRDVVEAQLENAERGEYHGYPLTDRDPLRDQILERWRRLERL